MIYGGATMNPKELSSKDPKTIFSQGLFWDSVKIDLDQHADNVIAWVLDFENDENLRKLRSIFPEEKLIQVIKTRRGLSHMTRRVWSVYSKLSSRERGNGSFLSFIRNSPICLIFHY
ncbi:MAG: hypothetical protein JW932_13745 [Deltaproteobacteria bacterium]|nr:hypothetical protein [Deltaproteobacteria bacterium]